MPTTPRPVTTTGDPDETADLDTLIREVVPDPDVWRVTPNPIFGGKAPNDLIGHPDEEAFLRDVLRAARHGFVS